MRCCVRQRHRHETKDFCKSKSRVDAIAVSGRRGETFRSTLPVLLLVVMLTRCEGNVDRQTGRIPQKRLLHSCCQKLQP